MTTEKMALSRRDQILRAVALMLETRPGERVTTAGLAREVGVSEAALYRHFSCKSTIYEQLIAFVEESLLSRINKIIRDKHSPVVTCEHILTLLLIFCEKNPGLTRILTGDALQGELYPLSARVEQLFKRIETHLRQVLRNGHIKAESRPTRLDHSAAANLMLALVEGRIQQFVRSQFKQRPSHNWSEQWQAVASSLFLARQNGPPES